MISRLVFHFHFRIWELYCGYRLCQQRYIRRQQRNQNRRILQKYNQHVKPADESARMELITNTFWTADYGQYIYEEAMSDTDSGSYKTLGGKTYSIKLSDLMSTNINEYEFALVDADSLNSKGYEVGLDIGPDNLSYLNVTVPNKELLSNTNVYIDFSDNIYKFGTGRQRGFT